MKEYRVKITVRNNLLLTAIERAGYKSQADFARAANINAGQLNALVGLREPPINCSGEFSHAAKNIMEILGACPSDLWTDEQLVLCLKRNSGERAISSDTMHELLEEHQNSMLLPDPEQLAMSIEQRDVVRAALNTLTPAEAKVLRLRFGIETNSDHTLVEIGKMSGVTNTRIGQIEAKALRKLRRDGMRKTLLQEVDDR